MKKRKFHLTNKRKKKITDTFIVEYVHAYFIFILCSVLFNRYRDPCSESLNEDDNHTITLVGNANKRAVTLAKTCEQGNELRDCRAPRDWSILALQNTRTGKSHYLVICKCPSHFRLGKYFLNRNTFPLNSVSIEVNACLFLMCVLYFISKQRDHYRTINQLMLAYPELMSMACSVCLIIHRQQRNGDQLFTHHTDQKTQQLWHRQQLALNPEQIHLFSLI